jgi:esterase
MKLFYRELGNGDPIVILHGLYGSSDNWMSIGRELSNNYRVILVDQRNHGRSPHSTTHAYADLAQDLFELFNELSIPKATVIGHSMGGKVAMLFAKLYPQLLKALVVVDILPSSYRSGESLGFNQEKVHRSILTSLSQLKPEIAKSREEIDATLAKNIPDKMVRQFLLKSLKRNERGGFSWILNVEGLIQNIEALMDPVNIAEGDEQIDIPTQFIKGEKSDYINKQGEQLLEVIFSNYKVDSVPNAGHWLHAENPNGFMQVLNSFLKSVYNN